MNGRANQESWKFHVSNCAMGTAMINLMDKPAGEALKVVDGMTALIHAFEIPTLGVIIPPTNTVSHPRGLNGPPILLVPGSHTVNGLFYFTQLTECSRKSGAL